MAKTNIEWSTDVWNPLAGCTKVSAGCKHCYAEVMAKRLAAMEQPKYIGTVNAKGHWTGKINLDAGSLVIPLNWKKPRTIFVNSMSDLFHEAVPDHFIDKVFAVMALADWHTFIVLTKRPERMRSYMHQRDWCEAANWVVDTCVRRLDESLFLANEIVPPLPNVILGVSVEHQEAADARIPTLLRTPAAVRFLSCEPLLGPLDLLDITWPADRPRFPETDDLSDGRSALHIIEGARIDWVIVGGESGQGARPMHPDWVRGIRDQCQAAGVPLFFKQWGAWREFEYGPEGETSQVEVGSREAQSIKRQASKKRIFVAPNGRYWTNDKNLPPEVPCRLMVPTGKKAGLPEIDGRTWGQLPGLVESVDKVD